MSNFFHLTLDFPSPLFFHNVFSLLFFFFFVLHLFYAALFLVFCLLPLLIKAVYLIVLIKIVDPSLTHSPIAREPPVGTFL